MTNQPAPPPTSNELALQRTDMADERTHLALMRTTLAEDRTLMAWIRTATSLISFGFTIYKGFQMFSEQEQEARLLTPRAVALIMMGLGVGALVIATAQYRRQMKALATRFPQYGPYAMSLGAAIATVIAGLGIIGFVLVFLRQ